MFTFTFLFLSVHGKCPLFVVFRSQEENTHFSVVVNSNKKNSLSFACRQFPGNAVTNSRGHSLFWKHRSLYSSWPKVQEMFRKRVQVQEMLRPIHFLGAGTNPPAGSLFSQKGEGLADRLKPMGLLRQIRTLPPYFLSLKELLSIHYNIFEDVRVRIRNRFIHPRPPFPAKLKIIALGCEMN